MNTLLVAVLLFAATVQGPRRLEPQSVEEVAPSLIAPEGTVIPVSLMRPISSKHVQEGDGVYARTIFPIAANDQIVIPIGTYVQGRVVRALRPGKVSGTAEMTINFHTLLLESGVTFPIYSSLGGAGGGTVERRGEAAVAAGTSHGQDVEVVTKRTVTGAGVGAIFGRGMSGVFLGAGVGAAAGMAEVLFTRGEDLTLPAGTVIDIVLDRPLER